MFISYLSFSVKTDMSSSSFLFSSETFSTDILKINFLNDVMKY